MKREELIECLRYENGWGVRMSEQVAIEAAAMLAADAKLQGYAQAAVFEGLTNEDSNLIPSEKLREALVKLRAVLCAREGKP